MKLACNYYPETEALVREGKIDIDYFKFPALGFQMGLMEDWDAFRAFARGVREIKPMLLHGLHPAPHDLCSPALAEAFDFETVNRLLDITRTPGISLHPTLRPVDPVLPEERLVDTITANLRFLRESYPALEFLSVENLDSLRFGALIQPQAITEIVTRSGCSLLLDISHAYCAARALGEDFRAYLSKLPLERVYEIHINGWVEKDNNIMCHVKINALGYQILEELLQRCNPKIITIEYGRHNDRIGSGCPVMRPDTYNAQAAKEIVEQVCRIREIIKAP